MHGTIKEKEIVLGYDPVDPYCLATYENRRWFKEFCRERLTFKRNMVEKLGANHNERFYQELYEDFECLMEISNSNKGFSPEDICGLKHPDYFREYTPTLYTDDIFAQTGISLDNISKLVILGHSIKSDETYLERILCQCPQLQQIILFSYDGEKQNDREIKEQFCRKFCKRIKKERY